MEVIGSLWKEHYILGDGYKLRSASNVAQVEIYTTVFCPFCVQAKRLLKKKGASFEEVDVGKHRHRRAEMTERSGGGRTVPQIFIDGKSIGGCDELYALESQGQLDPLLKGDAA